MAARSNLGGARPGAGAPLKYGEPTADRKIRWPVSAWVIVDDLAEPGDSVSDALARCLRSREGLRRLKETLVRTTAP